MHQYIPSFLHTVDPESLPNGIVITGGPNMTATNVVATASPPPVPTTPPSKSYEDVIIDAFPFAILGACLIQLAITKQNRP